MWLVEASITGTGHLILRELEHLASPFVLLHLLRSLFYSNSAITLMTGGTDRIDSGIGLNTMRISTM